MKILIGKADEFSVTFDDGDEQVTVFDGEGSIRLLMPYDIWQELTRPIYRVIPNDPHFA